MEIHQKRQIVFRGAFSDFDCGLQIVVAAAVTVSVVVVRIHPNADADVVHAVVAQDFEKVGFVSVKVAENHAAFFKRNHCGNVDATNEIVASRRGRGQNQAGIFGTTVVTFAFFEQPNAHIAKTIPPAAVAIFKIFFILFSSFFAKNSKIAARF